MELQAASAKAGRSRLPVCLKTDRELTRAALSHAGAQKAISWRQLKRFRGWTALWRVLVPWVV